ncbi:Trk system potassium uptake protein TrkG [Caulifigura coniformis]|uniref:Trk system potassium uptake protein TrkG n=1 Tax=Caulifigura coniformis TaxID=2527983 RepID=A0A517S7K9_9PLAN|nr:TrkH family potassium uptake protein [Caulifigura coniformis]QDT52118.1 Trk system potassium uptake protein TrkG [Caulifigura coniformis]
MNRSVQTIARDIGLVLHVPAAMALLSTPICFLAGEGYAAPGFLWTAAVSIALGQILYWSCRQAEPTRQAEAMLVSALAWLVIPLMGAIPFLATGTGPVVSQAEPNQLHAPWNAVFESFSGFTGTGLTMAIRPGTLPRSLQWWRSFSEWIGGIGVLVMMLAVLRPAVGAHHLYFGEGREDRILPSIAATARMIWRIYLLYTALSILGLKLAGMTWWESLNHAMTGIATGGFGVTDGNIADFGPGIRLALIPVMLAGMLSFAIHYDFLTSRRLSAFWSDSQHRLLWLLVLIGPPVVAAENYWGTSDARWIDSLFHWVSALSTAGFQAADLHLWTPTAQLLLCGAMIIGGAAGSTAGGLKELRLVLLYKGLKWRFRRIHLTRHEFMRYRLDGRPLSAEEGERLVESAAILVVIWLILLAAAVIVLLHFTPGRYELSEVFLEAASAQSNVGLSTGITHPSLPWPAKLTLIGCMWLGRLEIIPALLLGMSIVRRRRSTTRNGKQTPDPWTWTGP